ncbi:MAG: HAD-IC family P-type ATPase [Tessaracoccus sp.]
MLRDGKRLSIERDGVVLDDLIGVHPGDQVVVDGTIVEADYLEVDESMLTGEADPMAKNVGDEVLSGTFIVSGSGLYRAERVGAEAYAAQITAQASKFTLVRSELRKGIDRILRFVTYLLIPVGLLTIAVQFTREGSTWQEMVLRMVAALVPMLPEGLVLLTSMAFAVGVIRLGKRNCLVQELPAIEGLARVDVVCVDKTGTLTENAMHLGEIIPLGLPAEQCRRVLSQLVAADPAPNASMRAIAEQVPAAENRWGLQARAPFTSAKKWSGATFHEHGSWVLGAPDVLVGRKVAERAEQIGSTGRRVLLLAKSNAPVDSSSAPARITPAALLVLDQNVRPDAAETLDFFRDQGVGVKVISGDNAASVRAVTRTLGMHSEYAMDARTMPEPSPEFSAQVENNDVFGRVTPEQKRQMVDGLREHGHSVAMTGDGVNDVLALKNADLGVAMGSGSAATRSVAQIVLLDDRFATLPHVFAEGRRVIGNIERVAKLFLTKTIYAVTIALVIGVLRLPSPFLPLQMTVIGWFTIGIPAFLLSLAPNRERARPGFVSRTLAMAIPWGLIVAAATLTSYLIVHGFGPADDVTQMGASTAAMIALITTATWVLSLVARPYQWWRVGLVAFAYGFYAVLFLLPSTQRILQIDTDHPEVAVIGLVAGVIGAALAEAVWWIGARIRGERPILWRPDSPGRLNGQAPRLVAKSNAASYPRSTERDL